MTSLSALPLKLLIVDDDPMMRLGLRAALSNQDELVLSDRVHAAVAVARRGLVE